MGRDVPAISVSQQDRRAYREKVRRCLDVFARMLRESRFETEPRQVGLEIELNLVDELGLPSMKNTEVLGAIADPSWASELGQFNLEINVPPRPLAGDALTLLERGVRDSLDHAGRRARQAGSHLVMVGILPTLTESDVGEQAMSANPRYRLLNEQIFAARGEEMRISIEGADRLLTHIDTITPEAACTSVQCHLQVSPEAFGSYWNAAQAIAGAQVAVAANSPFLFGRELWRETRLTLFEQATDTRPDELKHPGGPAPGVVRRALDHLGVRPVRGEPAVFPRAAAAVRRRGSRGGAGQRAGTAARRADAAQRHDLPVEPAGLRGGGRACRTCGWRTGCCRPARRSPTSWPTPPSTAASSARSPRPSGRSGRRCRSRRRPTTSPRAPGTASTRGCTGPASARSR